MELYKPYALQFVSLLFLTFYFLFASSKPKKDITYFFLFILFILVSSLFLLRDYYGNIDIPRYMRFYEQNVTLSDLFSSSTAWKADYFFFLFMPLCHLLGFSAENYISFQLLLSVGLTFIAFGLLFKDKRSLIFLGLFFTINSSSFYLIHGNVIRQGLASSLLLLSLATLSSKREFWLKLLGFFTHKGVFFSFFTFVFKKIQPFKPLIFTLAVIIGYFSLAIIFLNLLMLPKFVQDKIEFYSIFRRASSNSILKLLLLVFFNAVFFLKMSHSPIFKRTHDLFFVFSIAAALFFRFDGLFSRLILYTDIFVPILTIGLILSFKNRLDRLLVLFVAIAASLAYSIFTFNHESIIFNMGEYLTF